METIPRLTDVEHTPQHHESPIVGIFAPTNTMSFTKAMEHCSRAIPDAPKIASKSTSLAEGLALEHPHGLTVDEIASINMYTLETNFYQVFNQTLRDQDPKSVQPFLPYLKHFLGGLQKLPSFNRKVWKGTNLDLKNNYPKGKKFYWNSFSSCTFHVEVLEKEQYCGKSGERTIFCIHTRMGKDISLFSNTPEEGEVVLMPGCFEVVGVMEPGNGLVILDIEEQASSEIFLKNYPDGVLYKPGAFQPRPRYCLIEGTKLSYCHTFGLPNKKYIELAGAKIDKGQNTSCIHHNSRLYITYYWFTITSHHKITLQADTREERDMWCAALEKVARAH